MATEKARTLEILRVAIQMEVDGKEFYLKASAKSGNNLGRQLLRSLAAEEDSHRKRFEEIFEVIRRDEAWPEFSFESGKATGLRTILSGALREIGGSVEVGNGEIEAVQVAIGMENKTYDFYQQQLTAASAGAERNFYRALLAEENGHKLALLDYWEYLKDPAAWFVSKEHPSLDGV